MGRGRRRRRRPYRLTSGHRRASGRGPEGQGRVGEQVGGFPSPRPPAGLSLRPELGPPGGQTERYSGQPRRQGVR